MRKRERGRETARDNLRSVQEAICGGIVILDHYSTLHSPRAEMQQRTRNGQEGTTQPRRGCSHGGAVSRNTSGSATPCRPDKLYTVTSTTRKYKPARAVHPCSPRSVPTNKKNEMDEWGNRPYPPRPSSGPLAPAPPVRSAKAAPRPWVQKKFNTKLFRRGLTLCVNRSWGQAGSELRRIYFGVTELRLNGSLAPVL